MTTWLVRDSLQDTGQPHPGSWQYTSPDIINFVSGESGLQDPLHKYTTEDSWKTSPSDSNYMIGGAKPIYAFVRAKNISGDSVTGGRVYLFWTTNMTISDDSQWNLVPAEDGNPYSELVSPTGPSTPPDGKAITVTPFVWQPAAMPLPGSHYCLIAMACGPGEEYELPVFSSYETYQTAIENRPDLALRNISTVNASTDGTFRTNTVIGNPGSSPEKCLFVIASYNYAERTIGPAFPKNTGFNYTCLESGSGVPGSAIFATEEGMTQLPFGADLAPGYWNLSVVYTPASGYTDPVQFKISQYCVASNGTFTASDLGVTETTQNGIKPTDKLNSIGATTFLAVP